MTTMLWWLLENTVASAVLIALVVILAALIRRRPALEHALWLVVLVKFVTPPVIDWPWPRWSAAPAFPPGGGVQDAPMPVAAATSLSGPLLPPGNEESPSEAPPVFRPPALVDPRGMTGPRRIEMPAPLPALPSAGLAAPPVGDAGVEPRDRWQLAIRLAFLAWLAGAAAVGAARLRRIGRQRAVLRRATTAPPFFTDEVARLARAFGVRPPPVLLVGGDASPSLWCVGAPRLLWPERLSGESDLGRCRGVIAHELAHLRRRDHWVAWLETAAAMVWWWNPLFWYARRRLRESAEIACDAEALSLLPDGRRDYAEAFLEFSSIVKGSAPAHALGVYSGDRRTFERRLTMMLSEGIRCRLSWTGLIAVALLAMVALPGWTAGQDPPPPDPTSSPKADAGKSPGPVSAGKDREGLESRIGVLEGKLDSLLEELRKLRSAAAADPFGNSANSFEKRKPRAAGKTRKSGGGDPLGNALAELAEGDRRYVITEEGGRYLLSAIERDGMEIWRLNLPWDRLLANSKPTWSLERSPDGKLLFATAAGPKVNLVYVLDPESGQIVSQEANTKDRSNSLSRGRAPADDYGAGQRFGPPSAAADPPAAGLQQLDLVGLGTAYIDAAGAVKLAKSRCDRLKSAVGVNSEEELDAAAINLETAEAKLSLLATIARSVREAARAEMAARSEALKRSRQLAEKGLASTVEAQQAEAHLAAAEARLRVLEEILNRGPTTRQNAPSRR